MGGFGHCARLLWSAVRRGSAQLSYIRGWLNDEVLCILRLRPTQLGFALNGLRACGRSLSGNYCFSPILPDRNLFRQPRPGVGSANKITPWSSSARSMCARYRAPGGLAVVPSLPESGSASHRRPEPPQGCVGLDLRAHGLNTFGFVRLRRGLPCRVSVA